MKLSIWELLGYAGILLILLWYILKGLGVIQSPVFVEMLPYLGAALAGGSIIQIVRDTKDRVVKLEDKTNKINEEVILIGANLKVQVKKIEGLEKDIKEEK